MSVWVTGARGMLGVDVMRQLGRWGVPCVGTGREFDIADLAVARHFLASTPVTQIVNCAAYTRVDAAETDEDEAYRVNALGPQVLGCVAAERGLPVVHFSTDYVFAGHAERPYDEHDASGPLGAYGRTKLAGEHLLQRACADSYVVRSSWLFGSGGASFVSTMVRLLRSRVRVEVVIDQVGRPTATTDLAIGALQLAGIGPGTREPAPPGVYHFAGRPQTSWYGFAKAVRDEMLHQGMRVTTAQIDAITTQDYPTPAQRPAWSVLDTSKIEAALGAPCPSWRKALGPAVRELAQTVISDPAQSATTPS